MSMGSWCVDLCQISSQLCSAHCCSCALSSAGFPPKLQVSTSSQSHHRSKQLAGVGMSEAGAITLRHRDGLQLCNILVLPVDGPARRADGS